jgi:hypothetical protein
MAAPLAAKAYLSTKPAEANAVGFVTMTCLFFPLAAVVFFSFILVILFITRSDRS